MEQEQLEKPISITVSVFADGMVTIDDVQRKHLSYGNIAGMYKGVSTQGVTMSLNTLDAATHKQVLEKCNEISNACYKLQSMLTEIESKGC